MLAKSYTFPHGYKPLKRLRSHALIEICDQQCWLASEAIAFFSQRKVGLLLMGNLGEANNWGDVGANDKGRSCFNASTCEDK